MGCADLNFLVVDDHMLMRKLITQQLCMMGCTHIDTAINGQDALAKLEEGFAANNPHNVVLLDWSMPIMDGLSVVEKCREDEKFDSIAFVMITGEREKERVLYALERGVVSYIVKPVSQEELERKMAGVIEWINQKQDGSNA